MNHVILCLTTYNRYEILKESLESLNKTNFPENCHLIIKDDCSTDKRVKELLSNFNFKIKRDLYHNPKNIGCDLNVLSSIEIGFNKKDEDYVFVLDSDAYYHPEWLNKTIELLEKEESVGMAGTFNAEKHLILEEKEGYLIKNSVGGFSIALKREVFENIPKDIEWDWKAVKFCKDNGYKILTTKESYTEHLGIVGTHSNMDNNKIGDCSSNFVGDKEITDSIRKNAKDTELKEGFDLINHDKKYLLIDIPGQASSYAKEVLFGKKDYKNTYKKSSDFINLIKNGEFKEYIKIAVVSNPFERIKNFFDSYAKSSSMIMLNQTVRQYLKKTGIDDFIKLVYNNEQEKHLESFVREVISYNPQFSNHFKFLLNHCTWAIEPILTTQYDYIYDGDKLLVDKLIKAEEVARGLQEYVEKKDELCYNYRGSSFELSEESIELINLLYKKDIEAFGYEEEIKIKKEKY